MKSAWLVSILTTLIAAGVWVAFRSPPITRPSAPPPAGEQSLALPLVRPSIVVSKAARTLALISADRVVRTYKIGLGGDPVGDKQREGDRRTPEGTYTLRLKNPKSQYTLSLGLDYPNAKDADRGLRDGLITAVEHAAIVNALKRGKMPPQKTVLGGEIFIHGKGSKADWTLGCIALDDDAIAELYYAVPLGAPIVVNP